MAKLQLVATAADFKGLYPLVEIMDRVEAHFRQQLDRRWPSIIKGVQTWNEMNTSKAQKFGFGWKLREPEIDLVAKGLAYSLLEKVMLQAGAIYLAKGDTLFSLSGFDDDLFYDGDYIASPAIMRDFGQHDGTGAKMHKVSPAARAACNFEEAARRSRGVPFFDAKTWSVRTLPRLEVAQTTGEELELASRWKELRPHAGTPILYRYEAHYKGTALMPSQIMNSVKSQADHMVDGRPPRERMPLWHAVLGELAEAVNIRHDPSMPVTLEWFALEFWNNADKDDATSIRRFHKHFKDLTVGSSGHHTA